MNSGFIEAYAYSDSCLALRREVGSPVINISLLVSVLVWLSARSRVSSNQKGDYMFKFKCHYVRTHKSTDLSVEINREDSDKQYNQSPMDWSDSVKLHLPMIISVIGTVLHVFGLFYH